MNLLRVGWCVRRDILFFKGFLYFLILSLCKLMVWGGFLYAFMVLAFCKLDAFR